MAKNKSNCFLLAVDPGANTGFATFDPHGKLQEFGCAPPEVIKRKMHLVPRFMIIETPEVYAGGQANANNLITLAIRIGGLIEYFETQRAQVTTVLPRNWKGSTPKLIFCNRTFEKLWKGHKEKILTFPKSKQHDVLDAIGLGMWFFNRIQPEQENWGRDEEDPSY